MRQFDLRRDRLLRAVTVGRSHANNIVSPSSVTIGCQSFHAPTSSSITVGVTKPVTFFFATWMRYVVDALRSDVKYSSPPPPPR